MKVAISVTKIVDIPDEDMPNGLSDVEKMIDEEPIPGRFYLDWYDITWPETWSFGKVPDRTEASHGR